MFVSESVCVCVWTNFSTFSYSHRNKYQIVVILTDFKF